MRNEYEKLTNITFSLFTVFDVLPAYCAGLKIPFNATFFDNMLSINTELTKLFWGDSYNLLYNTTERNDDKHNANQVWSSVLRYIVSEYVNNATFMDNEINNNNNNNDKYQIVYHSAHDTTILAFLGGLGASNGTWPVFAEMIVLEIYSVNNNENSMKLFESGYAFRLLRNGIAIKFDNCSNLIENGMELCDLNVILNILTDKAMSLKEWEVWALNVINNETSSTSTDTTSSDDSGDDSDGDCSNDNSGNAQTSAMIKGIFIGIGGSCFVFCVILIVYCVFRRRSKPERSVYSQF